MLRVLWIISLVLLLVEQDGNMQGKAVCKGMAVCKAPSSAHSCSEIAGACAKHSLGAALLAGTGQSHDVSW